jgi:hypothetical protein
MPSLFGLVHLCMPTSDTSDEPLLLPLLDIGETSGDSANRITLQQYQEWPQQFTSNEAEWLEFHVYLLVNMSLLPSMTDTPTVFMTALSPQQTAMRLENPNWHESFSEATQIGEFAYGQRFLLQFSATRWLRLSGEEQLQYEYSFSGGHPLTGEQQAACFPSLLNSTRNASEHAFVQTLSNLTCLYFSVDIFPRTLVVQTISEVVSYGWSSFLADVGGALNLMSLVVLLLFPIAFEPTKPRTFLALWLISKWRLRHEHETEYDRQEAENASVEMRRKKDIKAECTPQYHTQLQESREKRSALMDSLL